VESDNQENSNGAQPVDIGAVGQLMRNGRAHEDLGTDEDGLQGHKALNVAS
jgi:hypothetical protein